MMGLKSVKNESGESELVEREGAQPREVNWSQVARVSDFDCCISFPICPLAVWCLSLQISILLEPCG